METSMPLAANPVVSVLSSLSWNAARRMLNACTCGTWTPWRVAAYPDARIASSACDASERMEEMEEVSGSAFRTARASSFVPSSALVVAAAAGLGLARVLFDSAAGRPHCLVSRGSLVSSLPSVAAAREARGEERERRWEGRAETAARLVPGAGAPPVHEFALAV